MKENLALAYHNLSVMLDAGVPLMRTLDVTVQNSTRRRLKWAFRVLFEEVKSGSSISEGMEFSPKVFLPLDITIIQAAELSGSLPDSFKLLSDWYEFSGSIRRKMLSGLVFPIILIHVLALFAPLSELFMGSWNITSYILDVVTILSFFYIPAFLILLFRYLSFSFPVLRLVGGYLGLKVPLLGSALYNLTICRYCRIFHMLFKAGVPIVETAEKAAAVAGNAAVGRLLDPAARSVKEGKLLSEGFSDKLPAEFRYLWQVGEESGNMDEVAWKLGKLFGGYAELKFKEFGAWLPRVVYALVCGLIIYYIFKNITKIYAPVLTGF